MSIKYQWTTGYTKINSIYCNTLLANKKHISINLILPVFETCTEKQEIKL